MVNGMKIDENAIVRLVQTQASADAAAGVRTDVAATIKVVKSSLYGEHAETYNVTKEIVLEKENARYFRHEFGGDARFGAMWYPGNEESATSVAKECDAERRATQQMEAQNLTAPSPVHPDFTSAYDHAVSAKELPAFGSLPKEFGTTKYSAISLNNQTVAMSVEHYIDLLEARDECLELRNVRKLLESQIFEAGRRHVAIETLANNGATICRRDGKYIVVCFGAEVTGDESLTKAMENAIPLIIAIDGDDDSVPEKVISIGPDESDVSESTEFVKANPDSLSIQIGDRWETRDGSEVVIDGFLTTDHSWDVQGFLSSNPNEKHTWDRKGNFAFTPNHLDLISLISRAESEQPF